MKYRITWVVEAVVEADSHEQAEQMVNEMTVGEVVEFLHADVFGPLPAEEEI